MRRLRVGVIDLVAPGPTRGLYARALLPNFGTVMAQAVAVWCADAGHSVRYHCYTGVESLPAQLRDLDVVFVGAFTHAALAAYAVANLARSRGIVTVLGGPHARAYPADALRYFDFVLGLTDRELIREVLQQGRVRPRGDGVWLAAKRQPASLPGIRERWPFILEMQRGSLVKAVPMLGSLGCPYTCNFCVDAEVDYQALDLAEIKADLEFLQERVANPRVVWHDPNFGVRFDAYLDAIEESVPPGRIDFIAESSLSLLSEPHLRRLQRNGFQAMLPGVESWYELGAKSKTGRLQGREKVRQVAEHINTVLRHVPYVQTNFVMGLDTDEGEAPFELTAQFIDEAPGSFAAIALLTVYGESAPIGVGCRREGRLLPMPFHFMNSGYLTNVKPKHYSWPRFYDSMIRLLEHNFSLRTVARRHRAVDKRLPRWINLIRAFSGEGRGRIKYLRETRRRLDEDRELRRFFDGETAQLPQFFLGEVRSQLGELWAWLPPDTLRYDPYAVREPLMALTQSPLA